MPFRALLRRDGHRLLGTARLSSGPTFSREVERRSNSDSAQPDQARPPRSRHSSGRRNMRADGGSRNGKIDKARLVGVGMMLAGIVSITFAVAGVSGAGTSGAALPAHHQCESGWDYSSTTGQLAGAINKGCNQTTTTWNDQCGCTTTSTTEPVTTTSHKHCECTTTTTEAPTSTSTSMPTTTSSSTTSSSSTSTSSSTTTSTTTLSVIGETTTVPTGTPGFRA